MAKINPLAVLLSKVKTGCYYCRAFTKKATTLLSVVNSDQSQEVAVDFAGIDKWFREDVAVELSKLVRSIRQERLLSARQLFWITLAETIRVSSNDRTSTFKLHVRPPEEISRRNILPIQIFFKQLHRNIEDITSFSKQLSKHHLLNKGVYTKKVVLYLEDSQKKVCCPKHNDRLTPYDLLVSSPPYGDNKTTVPYGQHSYLALQWIDCHDIDSSLANSNFLSSTSAIDSKSIGGTTKQIDDDKKSSLCKASPTLSNILDTLNEKHKDKTSKIINFIHDLDASLRNVVNTLSKDAYMVWTIGN